MKEQKYMTVSNIMSRMKAKSPTFFKKIRRITVALGAAGAALIGAQQLYPEAMSHIPASIGGNLVAIGIVGTFIASLTVSDPNENPKIS